MSRFRTYAQFEADVARKIGEDSIDNQLGSWINQSFNQHFRDACTAAQWPDVCFYQVRNPDGNGLIAYEAGVDPVTGLAVPNIEFFWGVYSNTPYNNLTLQPANYLLDENGANVLSPTTEILANGYNAQISPVGPFWVKCVLEIPQYTGANYSNTTSYHLGDVVWDTGGSGNYWQVINVNAGQPLSNTTWWTSATVGAYSSGTTYVSGAIVYDLVGSAGGGYFQSNVSSNVGNALTNLSYWTPISIGAYASSQNYSLGNPVYKQSNATFYQSQTSNNAGQSLSNTTYWKPITVSAYSSATTYQPGQVVFIAGAGTFYQCIAGNTNQLISNQNFWQQIAMLPYNQTTIYSTYSNTNFPLPNVVFDASTPSYYTCALDTITQPLTAANYWQELGIPNTVYNYMVHSCYAEYLLTAKQSDKHKTETQFAESILDREKKALEIAQNQKPVLQVFTHLNTHYFN